MQFRASKTWLGCVQKLLASVFTFFTLTPAHVSTRHWIQRSRAKHSLSHCTYACSPSLSQPVVFLLTVTWRFLYCGSWMCACRFIYGVCLVPICSSSLLLLVSREGGAVLRDCSISSVSSLIFLGRKQGVTKMVTLVKTVRKPTKCILSFKQYLCSVFVDIWATTWQNQ